MLLRNAVDPFEPEKPGSADRKARIDEGLNRLATAAREGTIPGGTIENGTLRLERLASNAPPEADALVLDLYARLPEVRITDILIEVDAATGFTEAFTHLRTGAPCGDRDRASERSPRGGPQSGAQQDGRGLEYP